MDEGEPRMGINLPPWAWAALAIIAAIELYSLVDGRPGDAFSDVFKQIYLKP
jgi:hypothetical protein